jgi:hypothetical protein
MASTYYDWHLARSQNRMEQKPLFDNGVQVEKYHHKDGLVLNFLAVVSGKQFTVLLDKQHTYDLRNRLLSLYPTDEVLRLRIAMTSICTQAATLARRLEGEQFMTNTDLLKSIMDTAGSWPTIQEQAIDAAILSSRVETLEKQLKDMKDAAGQLMGIEGWIEDKDMKRHCTKVLDKLNKQI